jgi:hypothetical protein
MRTPQSNRRYSVASLLTLLLLALPVGAVAQQSGAEEQSEDRLRRLEAQYQQTGDPRYRFQRVLTLEEMGEYAFALTVLEENRAAFESDPEITGVALVEQRLRDKRREAAAASGASSTGDPSTVGWLLTAGGTALTAGGVASLLVAEGRARRLHCSPVSNGPAADCAGVDPYTGLTAAEFDTKKRGVTTLRGLGIGLGAVGLTAAGWGLVRLLAAETPPPRARIGGAIVRGGGVIGLHVRY